MNGTRKHSGHAAGASVAVLPARVHAAAGSKPAFRRRGKAEA